MKVIIDAEFDGLNPTRVWCIVCKDIDSGKVHTFRHDSDSGSDSLSRFASFCDNVQCWIGHNLIQFDFPHLNRLLNLNLDYKKCIDTLVVSRLVNFNKLGGHSVENWGRTFGMTKKFIDVWTDPNLINDYVERCVYDVEIQYRIYKHLSKYINDPEWASAMRIEHDLAYICHDMHANGFAFNKDKAEELLEQITTEMAVLENRITKEVPPVLIKDAPITLRTNKDGTTSKRTMDAVAHPASVSDGNDWFRFYYEDFNPGSAKQRIEYLNKAGWRPTEKTKGHLKCERELNAVNRKIARGRDTKKLREERAELSTKLEKFRVYGWRVSETNLDTLPPDSPPAARTLAKWLTLEGRRGDLEEWLSAYDTASQRIHGKFNGIGAWSHRMSHVQPNQGNIFSNFTPDMCKTDVPSGVEEVKIKYNGALRSLWRAGQGRLLVGTDAEGIQLRVLAHYINDKEFTDAIINGDKKKGTDVHSYNRSLLGSVCRSRDDAKTFIYAWLLGAGVGKVAEILGCSQGAAKAAMEKFVVSIPGLDELKRTVVPCDARRGYFVGLDGRKVICKYERLFITGYLQNGEKVVMAHANTKWRRWCEEEELPYWQVDFVHDEWVTETVDDMEVATRIGELQARAIEETGKDLGMNCALAGEYKIGRNWLEVH